MYTFVTLIEDAAKRLCIPLDSLTLFKNVNFCIKDDDYFMNNYKGVMKNSSSALMLLNLIDLDFFFENRLTKERVLYVDELFRRLIEATAKIRLQDEGWFSAVIHTYTLNEEITDLDKTMKNYKTIIDDLQINCLVAEMVADVTRHIYGGEYEFKNSKLLENQLKDRLMSCVISREYEIFQHVVQHHMLFEKKATLYPFVTSSKQFKNIFERNMRYFDHCYNEENACRYMYMSEFTNIFVFVYNMFIK
ncbi:unknown [Euproctis pseudoconspersa nucleopolyhedrovirus]|uniref:Uncharacterized protein n=1 Tax=Euproctis pseudoconspersa nucleopolyhedrovirus TaxID=307467 RepID=C3TX16_9ABAC|nr:hypothetical protein EupsNPV_gp108 [Euproctis pseudoconspersa nucleopolyhedrovirus]ACO53558.1 unknown [Euproctis pseudoconspersa nucleopolyhedrovirus]